MAPGLLGHNMNLKRTGDVLTLCDIAFDTMLLSPNTLEGLLINGFYKPSPVQLQGIPLGKCGFDLLIEAKSGTGKTAVFTVIALEKINLKKSLQCIIIAPTREIAAQICDVIKKIGSTYEGLCIEVVMGGLPIEADIEKFSKNKKVHIVVGSPGRLRHLIEAKHINTNSVRLVVLDEADKLIEKSFQDDIKYIFKKLPDQKQVVMCSATYSEKAKEFIANFLSKAQHVCPDNTSMLLGIEQRVTLVQCHSNVVKQTKYRYEELLKILTQRQFKQCLIFCNYQVRVSELYKMLMKDQWPSAQLYGLQQQTERLNSLKSLQEYKCRILISTDLAARGLDASNVDLVINFEPPWDWQTYLHRIGRAGRFGSYGIAISILSTGSEETKFKNLLSTMQQSLNILHLWSGEKYVMDYSNDSQNDKSMIHSEKQVTDNENKHNKDLAPKDINIYVGKLWEELSNVSPKTELEDFNNLQKSFKETKLSSFEELMNSFEDMKVENENLTQSAYKVLPRNSSIVSNVLAYAHKKLEDTNRHVSTENIVNHCFKTSDTQPLCNKYIEKPVKNKENIELINNTVEKENHFEYNNLSAENEMKRLGLPLSFHSEKDKRHYKPKIHNKKCVQNNYSNKKYTLNENDDEDSNISHLCKSKHLRKSGSKVNNSVPEKHTSPKCRDSRRTSKCKTAPEKSIKSSIYSNYLPISSSYVEWYNNLKLRTQYIEYMIYMEEMCNL